MKPEFVWRGSHEVCFTILLDLRQTSVTQGQGEKEHPRFLRERCMRFPLDIPQHILCTQLAGCLSRFRARSPIRRAAFPRTFQLLDCFNDGLLARYILGGSHTLPVLHGLLPLLPRLVNQLLLPLFLQVCIMQPAHARYTQLTELHRVIRQRARLV